MSKELELLPQSQLQPQRPSTPIALELHDHFARGGSAADAVRLVEALERNALATTSSDRSRAAKSADRGSRLSPDWQPTAADVAFACDRGLPPARMNTEAEKFRNYWIAKSGLGACKRDWAACWRNWIINAVEKWNERPIYPRTNSSPGRTASGSDAIVAGMGRLARRIDERRTSTVNDRRAIPKPADAADQLDLEPR